MKTDSAGFDQLGKCARACLLFLLFLGVLGSVPPVGGRAVAGEAEISEKYDDLDGAELALELARDGKTEEAERILRGLSSTAAGQSAAVAQKAMGVIARTKGDLEQAARHFHEALKLGGAEKSGVSGDVQLLAELAALERELGRPDRAVQVFENAKEAIWASEAAVLTYAGSLRQMKRVDSAWKTLVAARLKFPASIAILSETVDLLVELNLFQEALQTAIASQTLWRSSTVPLSLAEVFAKRSRLREATHVLETGLLRFHDDTDLRLALAQGEYRQNRRISSAHLFEKLAPKDPQALLAASELFRQEGWRTKAEYLHVFLNNPEDVLKQKLALSLDRNLYFSIAAMTPQLSSRGLLKLDGDHDEIIYASVYSRFLSGQLHLLLEELSNVKKPALTSKVVALKKAIEDCRKELLHCRN